MGMALTGACPGTVLVKVATGIRSGYFALAGGILGGTLYTTLAQVLHRGTAVKQEPVTIYQSLGMKEETFVCVYEVGLLAIILAASFTPEAPNLLFHPVVGGLMIGGAQAVSLALTGNAVGVSTGYEQVVNVSKWLWRRSAGERKPGEIPAFASIVFAVGIVLGSSMLSSLLALGVPGEEAPIGALTAMIGGLIMVFGARIAGGCTSCHGISGVSTFGISSIISVAAMFSGGIALAWIFLKI